MHIVKFQKHDGEWGETQPFNSLMSAQMAELLMNELGIKTEIKKEVSDVIRHERTT